MSNEPTSSQDSPPAAPEREVAAPGTRTDGGTPPNPLGRMVRDTTPATPPTWSVLCASAPGHSHVLNQIPNQDSYAQLPVNREGPAVVLAVSDGHGSAKCFRSDVGSRLAAKLAAELLWQSVVEHAEGADLSAIRRMVDEVLPKNIVRQWQQAVEEHLKANPFTPRELEALDKKEGAAARQQAEKEKYLAYGATLVVVAATERCICYLQLGDGDILNVSDGGSVYRPLAGDERLIANVTTSLCAREAWKEFRTHFQVLPAKQEAEDPEGHLLRSRPALIIVSTDGYCNSYTDEANFTRIGSDFLDLIREKGVSHIEENLRGWLSETSRQGSGDDVTLGIIRRADIDSTDALARAALGRQLRMDEQLEETNRTVAAERERAKAMAGELETLQKELKAQQQLLRDLQNGAPRAPAFRSPLLPPLPQSPAVDQSWSARFHLAQERLRSGLYWALFLGGLSLGVTCALFWMVVRRGA